MNIKQSRNIARIVLLVAFCVFVFAWEWKELSERGKSLEQSALVVAPALWIIDDKGPVEYLKISCQLHKYKKVTIFDFLNKPFLEIEGPELSLTDKLLGKIGLLPSMAVEADIEYEGEKIGRIVAIHRHTSIYIHLYVLLTFILIALVLEYFYRTVLAKQTLEMRVEERTQELTTSEKRYRTLIETMNDGMAVLDKEGRLIYANPNMVKMLGYSKEELIGRFVRDFFDDKNKKILAAELAERAEGKKQRYEIEWTTKDGHKVPTIMSPQPIFDEQGNYNGSFALLTDTTERKRLEAHLTQSQKMEAVGRLSGGIAHDFNNLLTTIIGYSQLALAKMPSDDPLKEKIEAVYAAGEKAAGLTRQLLAFSRKQVIEMKVVNLTTIINGITKMLSRVIREDIELKLHTHPLGGNIKADPGQIEQIIMNLSVNARDAMPKGGRLVFETDSTELDEKFCNEHEWITPGRYVTFSLTDTGQGMPPEVLRNIFDPFYTTKEQGKGTGLGLSTVYGIVKQHKGHIHVYSEVGIGTTFKTYFPEVQEAAESIEIERSTHTPRGTETILVVDDERSIRALLIDTLQPLGYTMLEANSGQEALEVAKANDYKFALLLTDIIMPGMNGRELANSIVAMKPDVKTIFMSGYTDNVVAHAGILEPGINFVNKPLVPSILAGKIRKVLDSD